VDLAYINGAHGQHWNSVHIMLLVKWD